MFCFPGWGQGGCDSDGHANLLLHIGLPQHLHFAKRSIDGQSDKLRQGRCLRQDHDGSTKVPLVNAK